MTSTKGRVNLSLTTIICCFAQQEVLFPGFKSYTGVGQEVVRSWNVSLFFVLAEWCMWVVRTTNKVPLQDVIKYIETEVNCGVLDEFAEKSQKVKWWKNIFDQSHIFQPTMCNRPDYSLIIAKSRNLDAAILFIYYLFIFIALFSDTKM